MNNKELKEKKKKARKNQDTDLRGSVMYLRPQECGYFQ